MNKTLLVGIVAVVALGLSGVAYFRPPTLVEKETVREVVKELGAFPGPVLDTRYLTVGGNNYHYIRQTFSTAFATTTPCAFQLGDGSNATTTILSVTVQGTSATSAVVMWNIATSSTAFATTSPIVPQRLVAGGQQFSFDIGMSTTSLVANSSTWLVVGARVTNATGDGYIPVDINGRCTALTQDL